MSTSTGVPGPSTVVEGDSNVAEGDHELLASMPAAAPPGAPSISPRGPLSRAVLAYVQPRESEGMMSPDRVKLACRQAMAASHDIVTDDDIQLALFVIYALSYRTIRPRAGVTEWDPALVEVRTKLEAEFEAVIRDATPMPPTPDARAEDVASTLWELTHAKPGPSVARYLARRSNVAQFREFLIHRSIYHLREADPHSWAIPRLTGQAKAALIEIQADEYGQGRQERNHAALFATTMRGVGLSDTYGHYIDRVPAITLASHNLMSMFGINGRLVGALMGHLAAFEMTSTVPNHLYAQAAQRHGFGEDVSAYFDEHVEADAVHEQLAAYDLAGGLVQQEPDLAQDVVLGAAAQLHLESMMQQHVLDAWERGWSALIIPGQTGDAA